MTNPKISLMICGTRLSQVGWEPQAILNNPPFPNLKNIGHFGVKDNPFYFTFRIAENYTQYTLVYNSQSVKAYQALRDGALKVSISIPKGYAPVGDATPYNVLLDLKRIVEQTVIKPKDGSQGVFEFNSEIVDSAEFEKVLNQFPLAPSDLPHRPMSESETSPKVGRIVVEQSQMDSLFKDVQYPEFAEYNEIVVIENGSFSDDVLSNLEIPRCPKYRIFADNCDITSSLKTYKFGYAEPIKFSVLEFKGLTNKREAYEDIEVNFTVNDALSGNCESYISVDKRNERINIAIPSLKSKKKTYQIALRGCTKDDVYNYLRVYVNGKEKTILQNNTIELEGEELIFTTIKVSIEGSNKYLIAKGEPLKVDSSLIVEIEERKQKPKTGGGAVISSASDQASEKKNDEVIKFKLIIEEFDDLKASDKPYKVRFFNSDTSFEKLCKFNKDKIEDSPQTKKCWSTNLEIPATWKGEYSLELVTDVVKYKPLKPKSFKLKPGNEKHIIEEDDTLPLKWLDKNRSIVKNVIYFFVACLLVVGGAVAGYFLPHKGLQPVDPVDPSPEIQVDDNPSEAKEESNNVKQFNKKLKEFLDQLSSADVSFEDVRNMSAWVQEHSAQEAKIRDFDKFRSKVTAYIEIIEIVEKPGSQRTFSNIQKFLKKHENKLDSLHVQYLRSTYIKANGGWITNDEESKVNQGLEGGNDYHSFKDIPSAESILTGTGDQQLAEKQQQRTGTPR